tara:strand:- start:283 stop:738 length:456 start_codon:yes stop_codon:yes gene_type:complete
MPHEPGHLYRIIGSKEPYNGRVIKIGDSLFTTVGGGIEGDRQEVESINTQTQTQTQNNNPVVRLFQAPSTPRYRRSDNNQLVPIGANLHEHQDGTIMTEHTMEGVGTPDGSVVVNVMGAMGETTQQTRVTRTTNRGMTNNNQRPLRGGGSY